LPHFPPGFLNNYVSAYVIDNIMNPLLVKVFVLFIIEQHSA
jgi:hypothetical protein